MVERKPRSKIVDIKTWQSQKGIILEHEGHVEKFSNLFDQHYVHKTKKPLDFLKALFIPTPQITIDFYDEMMKSLEKDGFFHKDIKHMTSQSTEAETNIFATYNQARYLVQLKTTPFLNLEDELAMKGNFCKGLMSAGFNGEIQPLNHDQIEVNLTDYLGPFMGDVGVKQAIHNIFGGDPVEFEYLGNDFQLKLGLGTQPRYSDLLVGEKDEAEYGKFRDWIKGSIKDPVYFKPVISGELSMIRSNSPSILVRDEDKESLINTRNDLVTQIKKYS